MFVIGSILIINETIIHHRVKGGKRNRRRKISTVFALLERSIARIYHEASSGTFTQQHATAGNSCLIRSNRVH